MLLGLCSECFSIELRIKFTVQTHSHVCSSQANKVRCSDKTGEHSHHKQNPLPALTCASFRTRSSIARWTAFRFSIFLLQTSQSGCTDSPVYKVPARKPEDLSSVPESLHESVQVWLYTYKLPAKKTTTGGSLELTDHLTWSTQQVWGQWETLSQK